MKYLRLMRVKHWCKNFLILFPVVFSGNLMDKRCLSLSLLGLVHFCVVSSIVYILNDIRDSSKDCGHPLKRNRPIAAGDVTIREAVGICFILFSVWIFGVYEISVWEGGIEFFTVSYLLTNIVYSVGMKEIPIVDVTMITMGYLIRLYFGGWLIGTGISDWMFLTVLSASYYLGFGKRKKEQAQYGSQYRRVLEKYPETFLDKSTQLFMGLTLVFYSLSCVSETTTAAKLGVRLSWSIPLVILIALRYNLLLEGGISTGDPTEMVFSDYLLEGLVLLYAVSILIILYWRY